MEVCYDLTFCLGHLKRIMLSSEKGRLAVSGENGASISITPFYEDVDFIVIYRFILWLAFVVFGIQFSFLEGDILCLLTKPSFYENFPAKFSFSFLLFGTAFTYIGFKAFLHRTNISILQVSQTYNQMEKSAELFETNKVNDRLTLFLAHRDYVLGEIEYLKALSGVGEIRERELYSALFPFNSFSKFKLEDNPEVLVDSIMRFNDLNRLTFNQMKLFPSSKQEMTEAQMLCAGQLLWDNSHWIFNNFLHMGILLNETMCKQIFVANGNIYSELLSTAHSILLTLSKTANCTIEIELWYDAANAANAFIRSLSSEERLFICNTVK